MTTTGTSPTSRFTGLWFGSSAAGIRSYQPGATRCGTGSAWLAPPASRNEMCPLSSPAMPAVASPVRRSARETVRPRVTRDAPRATRPPLRWPWRALCPPASAARAQSLTALTRNEPHPKAIRTYTSKPGGPYRTRSRQSTSDRSNHCAASAPAAARTSVTLISLVQPPAGDQLHCHAAVGVFDVMSGWRSAGAVPWGMGVRPGGSGWFGKDPSGPGEPRRFMAGSR
jgi:hypothetical protein